MGMKDGICEFCGKKAKLVKSHIIPKGLYWELHDSTHRAPKLVSSFDNEIQKKQPTGFYDYFLCDDHEKQFNDWDTYAIKLLRDSNPKKTSDGWFFEGVNYNLIKLFFISLLWRAHTATNIFFDKVSLGRHAGRLKKLIEQRNSSIPDEYAVVLWRSEELLAKVIIAPYLERHSSVSFIRIYLPGYMALIKVDERPLSQAFKTNALDKSSKWFVSQKKYAKENEGKVIFDVARKNLERKNLKRK